MHPVAERPAKTLEGREHHTLFRARVRALDVIPGTWGGASHCRCPTMTKLLAKAFVNAYDALMTTIGSFALSVRQTGSHHTIPSAIMFALARQAPSFGLFGTLEPDGWKRCVKEFSQSAFVDHLSRFV